MSFWDVTNAAKPKGIKDPNAVLDFPIDFSAWLTDITDTYASHTVSVDAESGIVCDSSSQAAGVITPIISGGTAGKTGWFKIRIVTAGGRTDDRTFYLKIQER